MTDPVMPASFSQLERLLSVEELASTDKSFILYMIPRDSSSNEEAGGGGVRRRSIGVAEQARERVPVEVLSALTAGEEPAPVAPAATGVR